MSQHEPVPERARRLTPVGIERHPPERRGAKVVTTHCGCCCCCCCCLHSAGSLVGAAAGSVPAGDDSDAYYVRDEDDPELYRKVSLRRRGGSVAVSWYWLSLIILCVIGASGGVTIFGAGPGVAIWFWVLFYLPALQLGASVIALVAVLIAGAEASELRQLGKITGWSVVGAIIGIVLMVVSCGGLGLFK